MDIAVVGVVASFVAFRLIKMTTGRQAAAPLDRRRFLGHMAVLVLLLGYCVVAGLTGAWRSRAEGDDARLTNLALKARVLLETGRADEAAAVASRALAGVERAGPADPRLPTFLDLKARCLVGLQKYAEAEALYRRSLDLRVQALGEGHPDTALGENNLGTLYVEMGRNGEAEAAFRRALSRTERVLGQVPPVLPVVLENLAKLCDRTGRPDEAKTYRERAKGFLPR